MPSVVDNQSVWGDESVWELGGDEWSRPFGGTEALWSRVLEPRIGHLIGGHVVEIAPGYGRVTDRLLQTADRLVAVDLNENCVRACRERFAQSTRFEAHRNDGRSLPMVGDGTTDLVVSFDALVHVDADVMRAYLTEIARILKPDGVAFVHHSNVGSYVLPIARLLGTRLASRLNTRVNHNWRGADVSARAMRSHARLLGLRVNVTERITWHSKLLNDAFVLVSRRGAEASFRNFRFFERPEPSPRLRRAYQSVSNRTVEDHTVG
jgi:SAM-dependent methyltransferase